MDDIFNKIKEYRKNSAIIGRGHYLTADVLALYNRILGIPVVVITVVIGSTIFGTINKNPDIEYKITAGLISLLAAVLSSLQTTLKFSENSEKHKASGAKYRAVMRQLDILLLKYANVTDAKRSELIAELERVQERLTKLAAESPNLPDKLYLKAEKEIIITTGS